MAGQRERDRELWAAAGGFDDLARLGERFVRAEITFFPGWLAPDLDEESDEIEEALAHLNAAGFLTLASQPGREPAEGFGGHTFAQRAFVAGFASVKSAEAIQDQCAETRLIVAAYPASLAAGGARVPVGLRDDEPTTWAGHAAGSEELDIFAEVVSPECLAALRRTRYVSVIDPLWERTDLLWQTLCRALAVPVTNERQSDA